MRHTGRNQDGEIVATATRVALMWCAPAEGGAVVSRVRDWARRCCSVRPIGRSGTRRRSIALTGSSSIWRTRSLRTRRRPPAVRSSTRSWTPTRVIVRVNPAGDRGLHGGSRDAVADRLPADHGRQGGVRETAQEDRPALRGDRPVRDREGGGAGRSHRGAAECQRADVGRRGPRREHRRHLQPKAQRPLSRHRADGARARAARRGVARQGRDRRRASRHRRHEAPDHRGDGCRGIRLLGHRLHPPEPGRRDPGRVPSRRQDALRGRARCWQRPRGERGVFTYGGRMVDEPVLRHARGVLRKAE